MEITNIIINIGISVVGGAAGCGLFVWLGKKWVGNWFAKDLKKYEQQLDLLKTQAEIRMGSLHSERVAMIKSMYASIVRLRMNFDNIYNYLQRIEVDMDDTLDEKTIRYIDEQLLSYILDQSTIRTELELEKIYFTSETVQKIEELINLFQMSYDSYIWNKHENPDDKNNSEIAWDFIKYHQNYLSAITEANAALETDFRELLGVYRIKE